MSDEVLEGKLFATFEKHGEFFNIQRSCLNLDLNKNPSEEEDRKEIFLFKRLSGILDEYQEQSYLLDPYLEAMVEPVVDCLRSHAKASIFNNQRGSPDRVERLATLLYSYVKCRGYKTIIRFFPHEIADLSIALDFVLLPHGLICDPAQWALRYVVLIWLSLICMIPFDLAQFDEVDQDGHTAVAIETTAKGFLGRAGLEREGAALLLSRLYTRQDTVKLFRPFLEWSQARLETGNTDVIAVRLIRWLLDVFNVISQVIGLLQAICEVAKSGSVEQLHQTSTHLFDVARTIDKSQTLSSNTAVRKYKVKLLSRIAIRLLPAGLPFGRRKGRLLTGKETADDVSAPKFDMEVPAEVEDVLEHLFAALQDKVRLLSLMLRIEGLIYTNVQDTVVRWSAAKGIARISDRLPPDFSDQILETILGLFSIHAVVAASLYDLPAIAESTWHGACLACAELARRGLVAPARLSELIEWLSKALYFDLRKGAHSIGSNVRDAAAYVNLAQRLTAVALYDREIHIRRAASAAFQEHVGRNNLFPHGIDVLGKTDFYAVSIRRNAFLTAAPQVAQHREYRAFLLNHILDVTTRLLDSIDMSDLHGGLLALSEIAIAYSKSDDHGSQEARMREIFRCLARIPFDILVGSRNAIVTAAACRLISITLTLPDVLPESTSIPQWNGIVDYGLKHRLPLVQEAAAGAIRSLSRIVDCSNTVKRLVLLPLLLPLLTTVQQSLGTLLGTVDYSTYNNALPEAITCVLEFVNPSTPPKLNIEARRNCYTAISCIISATSADIPNFLSAEVIVSMLESLLKGLGDYSTDQRGDVGSWIRVASIRSLTNAIEDLMRNARTIPEFHTYLPPSLFHSAISGILKQGVERLDNVRQEAGECFLRILSLPLPDVENATRWQLPGSSLLKSLFGR
ncbi:hypothetical protein DXG01_011950 [Tephrocybe rancida]|nr:hypothetical protein DXG01_011950 [Tephrocybe rancida]